MLSSLLSAGGNVLAVDGARIGSIGQVYADDDSGNPAWVMVKTGLFGSSESFAPLEGARVTGNVFEARPKTPFQFFDPPQGEPVPLTAEPEEGTAPPRQAFYFPDIFPIYPFL